MRTDIFTLAKNKEFLKLWSSYLFSTVCAYFLSFILMDQVYGQTGSALAVGLLWGFYLLPTLIFGPFSGVLVDCFNKKKLIIASCIFQIISLLMFYYLGVHVWMLYGLLMIYSFFDEFFSPAVAVLIPSVVEKIDLPTANALTLFTSQGSMALGFLAGGLFLKFFGFSKIVFLVLSTILLLSALFASWLKWTEKKMTKIKKINALDFWQKLGEGYLFISKEPLVFLPILFLGALQIVIGMAVVLLPSISENIAGIKMADSSYLLVLPVIIGAVAGSVIVQKTNGRYLKRVLIINGLFVLGLTVFSLGAIVPRTNTPLIGSILVAFFGGLSFVNILIPLQLLVQEKTPFQVRGRVFGVLNTTVTLGAAIPVLGAVTLVDLIGIKTVLGLMGIVIIIFTYFVRQGRYGLIPANGKYDK